MYPRVRTRRRTGKAAHLPIHPLQRQLITHEAPDRSGRAKALAGRQQANVCCALLTNVVVASDRAVKTRLGAAGAARAYWTFSVFERSHFRAFHQAAAKITTWLSKPRLAVTFRSVHQQRKKRSRPVEDSSDHANSPWAGMRPVRAKLRAS